MTDTAVTPTEPEPGAGPRLSPTEDQLRRQKLVDEAVAAFRANGFKATTANIDMPGGDIYAIAPIRVVGPDGRDLRPVPPPTQAAPTVPPTTTSIDHEAAE